MSAPHTDVHEVSACLDAVKTVLDDVLAARTPQRLAQDAWPAAAQALVETVNRLADRAEELAARGVPLSGDLATGVSESPTRLARLLAEREAALQEETARRRDAEEALQRGRDLLVAGPVIFVRFDAGEPGTVRYVSPNISTFGFSPDELTVGREELVRLIHPDDLAWVVEDGRAKAAGGLEGWTQRYRIIDAHGAVRWLSVYLHAFRDAEGNVSSYDGYVVDITAEMKIEASLRRREESLRGLALVDELTGLYNRRGLFVLGEHMMRSAVRHGCGVGVVYVDLDDLAAINARLGHERGDEALRDAADILRASVHEADVLARAGGDEFVVLTEDEAAAAAELATRITRRLAAGKARGARPYRLSAGVAHVYWTAEDGTTLQNLIDGAERRLREDRPGPHEGRRRPAAREGRHGSH